MDTEVITDKKDTLSVRVTEDEIEQFVRRTLNLSDDWSYEGITYHSSDVELEFEKYENDTRTSP
jgi:hypothetical protein